MKKLIKTPLVVFMSFILLVVGTFTYFRIREFINSKELRDDRISKTKNLTAIPLKESPILHDWYYYQSRSGDYSFSFPKNWIIKECQVGEDCDYYPATSIHPLNSPQDVLQRTFLQISYQGISQCAYDLVSNGDQISAQYLDVAKYYGSIDRAISMPIKHGKDCFEFLGNYSTNEEEDVIRKVLSSFRFTK